MSTVAEALPSSTLSHLRQLEAESIHILREVAAEFDNPVMLYSIGKDSSVMVHLAKKAFAPATLPFPLLHIDTTWKFREMIEFRDRFCKENAFDLKVHTNQKGVKDGVGCYLRGGFIRAQACVGHIRVDNVRSSLHAPQ